MFSCRINIEDIIPNFKRQVITVGIGIDITEVSRIESLAEQHEKFLTRVYTEREITYCNRKKNKYQHFAARFAAKESVLKALGVGWSQEVKWTDIEVVNDPNGRPRVTTYGGVKKLMEQRGVKEILISLSHIAPYAIASAQLVKGK
jgi:holo-[acyl-carrier protein] synthase